MDSLVTQLSDKRIIPVVALDSPDQAVPLAQALVEGGIPTIEVTFRTKAAAQAIAAITEALPEVLVGAGTVLSPESLQAAVTAGARFAVAPGFNPRVVAAARELGIPFIPGVATPSEIEAALDHDCKILKFFPATALGGVKALKAIAAPYRHTGVKFIPTGGINLENLDEWLALDSVIAVGGTWLAKQKDITDGCWGEITERCRTACTHENIQVAMTGMFAAMEL